MKINTLELLKLPSYAVSIVTLYELFVKYTGLNIPNLTDHFSPLIHANNFLTILIISIAFILSCIFITQKFIKRQIYYKYCPECDFGINAKYPDIYCNCGTKYIIKCPKCNKRIIRPSSPYCSFCGHNFQQTPKLDWADNI